MKYLSIIKYVLLLLSVVIAVWGISSYTENDPSTEGGISAMITFAGIMLGLTAALVVIMPVISIAQNPASAKRSLIGIALMGVVFFAAYAMADIEPITLANGEILDNPTELKFSDIALYSTYITFGALVVAMVGSELYKAIK